MIRKLARSIIGNRFYLSTELPTGVKIEIKNYDDWIIFTEIFLKAEYDEIIRLAVEECDSCNVLDLGGNVGYFSLRFADRLRARHPAGSFRSLSVEPVPKVFQEMQRRYGRQPFADSLRSICGLAGSREGSGVIKVTSMHFANSMGAAKGKNLSVPYIDLAPLTTDWKEINLLKCDIEGSELDFVRNYPELMKKTRYAAFEFHPANYSVTECRAEIEKLGFVEIGGHRSKAYPVYFYRNGQMEQVMPRGHSD